MEIYRKYKYTPGGVPYDTIYECIAELDTGEYILVYTTANKNKASQVVLKNNIKYYVEYIEPPKPVVHTRCIHWWRNIQGVVYPTIDQSPRFGQIDGNTARDGVGLIGRTVIQFSEEPKKVS